MIEQRYEEIIAQCKARISDLSEWEQGFLLGDPTSPNKKPPLDARTWLSDGQKKILDRIVCERFNGEKFEKKTILTYGDITSSQTDNGWITTIAKYPIGKGVTKKEAEIINGWLSTALAGILSLPKEVLEDYINTPAEVPAEEPVFGEEKATQPAVKNETVGDNEDEF